MTALWMVIYWIFGSTPFWNAYFIHIQSKSIRGMDDQSRSFEKGGVWWVEWEVYLLNCEVGWRSASQKNWHSGNQEGQKSQEPITDDLSGHRPQTGDFQEDAWRLLCAKAYSPCLLLTPSHGPSVSFLPSKSCASSFHWQDPIWNFAG